MLHQSTGWSPVLRDNRRQLVSLRSRWARARRRSAPAAAHRAHLRQLATTSVKKRRISGWPWYLPSLNAMRW